MTFKIPAQTTRNCALLKAVQEMALLCYYLIFRLFAEENEVEDSGELIYSKHVDDEAHGHLMVESLKAEPLYKKMKNLTVGYLTAIKGELKVRQGLAVSGAFTMALDEVSFSFSQSFTIFFDFVPIQSRGSIIFIFI